MTTEEDQAERIRINEKLRAEGAINPSPHQSEADRARWEAEKDRLVKLRDEYLASGRKPTAIRRLISRHMQHG